MDGLSYEEARCLSRRIAAGVGTPLFYAERNAEIALSGRMYLDDASARACAGIVAERGDRLGHGLDHSTKVAVESGALVLIESGQDISRAELQRRVRLAHLAGILHDIRRDEENHARCGAEEAVIVLTSLRIPAGDVQVVSCAIVNHEAFQPEQPVDDREAQLISDALYDADKFRWGPDNFTDTIWAMLACRGVPLSKALPRFLGGLDGIRRIRDTFRTGAGRQYGPDFIDRGLAIGARLYAELTDDASAAGGNAHA
ncbi:MAG: hypothetical protein RBT20_02475 [Syntrophales bacterium]|nr:hypothetical protein [Syntrophales bacterium]